MTTYTLTEDERQTLMKAIQGPIYGEPVFGKPIKDALKCLANLQPNTQEPVAWLVSSPYWDGPIVKINKPTTSLANESVQPLYTAPQSAEPQHVTEVGFGNIEPIGFISETSLSKLRDPEWQALRGECVSLWSIDNPPSRAQIPIYTAPQPLAPLTLSEDDREEICDQLRNTHGVEGDIEEVVAMVEQAILAAANAKRGVK